MADQESDNLDRIAEKESFDTGVNGQLMRYRFESLRPYFKGKACLELGCAGGGMTKYLPDHFDEIVAVDGSEEYCKQTRKRVDYEGLTVENELFTEFDPQESFDTILACHVLEHVDSPNDFLVHVHSLLDKGGVLLIDVPNANSLHRQVGVKMGLLDQVDQLNSRDRSIGHQRVYRTDEFHDELQSAGFSIITSGGVFLKPLTNSQMEMWFDEDMMDGFAMLGREYPHIAAEMYAVCSV